MANPQEDEGVGRLCGGIRGDPLSGLCGEGEKDASDGKRRLDRDSGGQDRL